MVILSAALTIVEPSQLPAHDEPSDLAHLVLGSAASLGAILHRVLVGLDQEGWRRCARFKPLALPDSGEIFVVLARPVDIDAAGCAIPFFIWCFGTTLRTLHRLIPPVATVRL